MIVLTTTIIVSWNLIIAPSHGWVASLPRRICVSHFKVHPRLSLSKETQQQQQHHRQQHREPDNRFGNKAYWDESYRNSLGNILDDDCGNGQHNTHDPSTGTFSWYCGWKDELEPFFAELVPPGINPSVLVPGIGNDACIRDMFDAGYRRLTAFDYAPAGVECARRMLGPERLRLMEDLRVADARSLPYRDASYDAVLDKGTLDSIYLSGGKNKELSRMHLSMAITELARVVKVGGIVFCVTAACVDEVQRSFDACNDTNGRWRQIRDGTLYVTEDGYTSNNVDATILVWERIG
ncbi:hypothetical protein ACHAW5_005600 [Stephanodiscus triporus]|uniref:Methyltransferase type 11 domain-containing protein n=1 Tax=Stephanodiscus triporus TaxID=2934178 RepID=A0ABD3QYN6_9STRA